MSDDAQVFELFVHLDLWDHEGQPDAERDDAERWDGVVLDKLEALDALAARDLPGGGLVDIGHRYFLLWFFFRASVKTWTVARWEALASVSPSRPSLPLAATLLGLVNGVHCSSAGAQVLADPTTLYAVESSRSSWCGGRWWSAVVGDRRWSVVGGGRRWSPWGRVRARFFLKSGAIPLSCQAGGDHIPRDLYFQDCAAIYRRLCTRESRLVRVGSKQARRVQQHRAPC